MKYVGDVLNLKEYKTKFKLQSDAVKNTLKLMSPPNTTQSMVIPEEQDFQSVPISNFLKMYPHNGENFSQPEEY